MFKQKETRLVLSSLARVSDKWISFEQLEFAELSDLDKALKVLSQNDLVHMKDEWVKLNIEQYQRFMFNEFPVLKEFKQIVKHTFIDNPLKDGVYDLKSGTILILSDFENVNLLINQMSPIVNNYGYKLKSYKNYEILEIKSELEVL